MLMLAFWHIGRSGFDKDGTWNLIGSCHAQRFKVQQDAWDEFTRELVVDGNKLIADNHNGSLLQLFTDHIYELATPREEFLEILAANGGDPEKFPTVEGAVRWWRETLELALKG